MSVEEILKKHGVYTRDLEIDLLRHFVDLRNEILQDAKNTEQQLQPENVLPVCWQENCPKWSEDICQSPDKCIEDVSG